MTFDFLPKDETKSDISDCFFLSESNAVVSASLFWSVSFESSSNSEIFASLLDFLPKIAHPVVEPRRQNIIAAVETTLRSGRFALNFEKSFIGEF